MRIAVLGPLAVWAADGTPLDVRGVRLRGLLARLAVDAGRPVGVDTLVDALWGPEAPSANAIVDAYADVELVHGDPRRAAMVLGAATALRGMRGEPDTDVRRTVERARAELDVAAYDAAYETGAAMSREEATAFLSEHQRDSRGQYS